jgi:DNA modification methylase
MQMEDIELINVNSTINNKSILYNIDSRIGLDKYLQDKSVDLVITSPPYLNSRDYTDTYMLELRTLEFTSTLEDIKELRKSTLRSHVQIKWKDMSTIENEKLRLTLEELNNAAEVGVIWNDSIIDMVRLYFIDIKKIFNSLYRKLKANGRVYFNISNSAYFNILINTLEICASIAEQEGFKVLEIRKARLLKSSPQQKEVIGNLLEGVIVLEK